MSLEELSKVIQEAEGKPRRKSKRDYDIWALPPVIALTTFVAYVGTKSGFCTTLTAVVITYLTFTCYVALKTGDTDFLAPKKKQNMESIEIPEEFVGRPKLFLAYLVGEMEEQARLEDTVEHRPPGNDPTDRYNMWDRL